MPFARRALLFTDLVLTAAIAGFFYAYSCSVLIGFDAAEAPVAIAAMQAINATIRNAYFAPSFFGPLVIGLAVIAVYVRTLREPAALAAIAAVLVYGIGGFYVTYAISIPLNAGLATVDGSGADAAAIWADYRDPWGIWNVVRTASSLASVALLGLALYFEGDRARTG